MGKIAWLYKYDEEDDWHFSLTEPSYQYSIKQIIYFEVEK